MTAATTPSPPNAGDWPWPLKPPISPTPPLELQFLPPSSSSSTSSPTGACRRPPRASPWTVDPSRLQKLMMGTIPTGEGVAKTGPSSSVPSVPPMMGSLPDLGASLDPGINRPLPSGWERCLDLKSGEVFIKKKNEVLPKGGMDSVCAQVSGAQFIQRKDRKQLCAGHGRVPLHTVQEERLDWSHKWMGSRMVSPMQPPANSSSRTCLNVNTSAKTHSEEEGSTSPERKPLCLDLDLSLTSMNRSRLTSEALDMDSLNSSSKVSTSAPASWGATLGVHQSWKWQVPTTSRNEKPTSIQEMISESTMATAVCSKCLMYVLLKKSNPTCPRCLNPIILDCCQHPASLQKRPRLELAPDELSLSTDSSR